MTRDVLLSIRGHQALDQDQNEDVEVFYPGHYCKRGNNHYVQYVEVVEGTQGGTNNLIKFRDHCVEVQRRGFVNAHMVFEESKKSMTYYNTPYGTFSLGISTTSVKVNETEEQIDLSFGYDLQVDARHLVDCTVDVTVRAQNGGSLAFLS